MNGMFMFRKDGATPSSSTDGIAATASKAFSSFKSFISKATSSAPQASGPTSHLDKYKHILIRSNAFKDILGWSVVADSKTFKYSVPGPDPDHHIQYVFESPLFDEMPQACQEIVNLILQQMQKESDVAEKSLEDSNSSPDQEGDAAADKESAESSA